MSRCLPLKRAEISLNNFNEIAIPHLLELLRKHKENIQKTNGEFGRIKNEQINATRVIKQLKNLLEEIEVLRQQIIEKDLPKFDQLTERSRNLTNLAIKDYMDMTFYKDTASSVSSGYSSNSPPSYNNEDVSSEDIGETVHLQVDESQLTLDQIRQQEDCLETWESLQSEVRDLHELFVKFDDVVHEQAEPVNIVERNVDASSENVKSGLWFLRKAERFKTAYYPIAGALIGGCVAGPIGLISGLKIGGLALVGGSALGFTTGKIFKKKREESIDVSQDKRE